MNLRTVFLASTLVLVFFTSNTPVADDDLTTETIEECEEVWAECIALVAELSEALEKVIEKIYDRWIEACDNLYDACMESGVRLPIGSPNRPRVPGETWLICLTARGTCKAAARAFKASANVAENLLTGHFIGVCNDAKNECKASFSQ